MYKKILTISLLIIILMSIFSVNCYAATDFKFTFTDKGLDLPDINISDLEFEPKYFTLFRNGSTDNLYFNLTEYPFDITEITDNGSYIFSCQQGLFYRLVLNSGSTSWEFKNSGSTPVRFSTEKENALYSNYDIYYNDELIKESDEKVPSEDVEEPEIQYYYFKGFDDIEYKLLSLPEGIMNYKHFIITKDTYNRLDLFGFNDSLSITRADGFTTFNGDENTTLKIFKYENNKWVEYSESGIYSLIGEDSMVINSCIDLLKYEEDFNKDEGFFYKPLPLETQGTLAPIIHKVETKGTMMEIIQILPLIIVVVVSLVGLRKALKMLSIQLNRS